MLKPFMRLAIMFGAAVVLAAPSNVVYMQEEEPVIEEVYEYVEEPTIVEIEEVVETYIPEEETEVVEPEPEPEPEILMSIEDIELIALVTMAEAEGECEEGKRLVIDTILNRVDSKRFPNTVKGVIYQPAQFSSMWNGRVDRCYVMEDICQLVREELQSRTNYDVVFFHAGKYGKYGKPLFQVGNHYFSSYA